MCIGIACGPYIDFDSPAFRELLGRITMTDETLIANVKEVGQHLADMAKEAKARGIEVRIPAGSIGLTAGDKVEVWKKS